MVTQPNKSKFQKMGERFKTNLLYFNLKRSLGCGGIFIASLVISYYLLNQMEKEQIFSSFFSPSIFLTLAFIAGFSYRSIFMFVIAASFGLLIASGILVS